MEGVKMHAWVISEQRPFEKGSNQLIWQAGHLADLRAREILLEVSVCGLCHTDLHIIEGDIGPLETPRVPGHQVVGRVVDKGSEATRFALGDRVGVAWLNHSCGQCEYCASERENLCENIKFTGFHRDGGFAEYMIIEESFAYALPERYSDEQIAPLLCAGIVGYRALKQAGVTSGERIGLYGFGASAHIALQILAHWNCEVYVFSRGAHHLELASQMGAQWTGKPDAAPPMTLHRAIIFAPVGSLMVQALKHTAAGGVVTSAGIYMSDIPSFQYSLLWGERVMNSVANATRADGEELMALAGEVDFHTEVEVFPMAQLPEALLKLKRSTLRAAAVLSNKL